MVLFAVSIRQLQISLPVKRIKKGRKGGRDRGTEGERKAKESGLS